MIFAVSKETAASLFCDEDRCGRFVYLQNNTAS
jgi:hypothetical protein